MISGGKLASSRAGFLAGFALEDTEPHYFHFSLFFYCQFDDPTLNPSRTARCKGPIAQLVEQRIENPCVLGSNPSGATT